MMDAVGIIRYSTSTVRVRKFGDGTVCKMRWYGSNMPVSMVWYGTVRDGIWRGDWGAVTVR